MFLCISPTDVTDGGSGTKTGNPAVVTGMVINRNGTTVDKALVVAHKIDYLHNVSLEINRYSTTTDKNGTFTLSIVDTGNFNIEINDADSGAVLLHYVVENEDVSINLGTEVILPYASIKGMYNGVQLGKLYDAHIYGLERAVSVDRFGKFNFDNLPTGEYSICITEKIQKNRVESYNLTSVNSGDTTVIPYSNLKFSQKIFLIQPHQE